MNKDRTTDICRKCTYYIQHYAFFDGVYRWVYLGHCTRGRLKPRRPDAKACEHYHEVPTDKK